MAKKKKQSATEMPPHDLKAERGVLGSIFIEPNYLDEVRGIISETDFYSDNNGRLFRRLCEMRKKSIPIDAITASNYLEECGDLEEVGGESYLGEVIAETAVASHVLHYAEIVKEKFIDRRCREIGLAMQSLDHLSNEEKASKRLALAEELRTLQERAAPKVMFVSAYEAALEVLSSIDNPDTASVVPTGFPELDEVLNGGFRPGQDIIIAARPSVGKTAFATQLMINMSITNRIPAAFFTLEMSRLEIMQRIVCNIANVPFAAVNGYYKPNEHQLRKMSEAGHEIGEGSFYIVEVASMSVGDIEATLAAWMKANEIRLVFIDQLDKLTATGCEGKSDYEHKSAVSIALKKLARRLKIPVVTLTQVNRDGAQQQKRPNATNMKGSGPN